MKIIIGLGLLSVLLALGAAGFQMLRRPDGAAQPGAPQGRMARALALRVAISIALFLLVLFSYLMGWIQPTGVPMGR